MPKFSTKHEGREQTFSFTSFIEGLNQDIAALLLPPTALSKCSNMKYAISTDIEGNQLVTIKKRQGTTKITATALASSVLAETYYVAQSQYVIADSAKLYYLDAALKPVEIGAIDGIPTFTEFHDKLIIHDSGITKAWNGTTFETLNGLVDDEIIETGDNSETEFAGTLAHTAVAASSLTIEYTDTTAKEITDDGVGKLTGDVADTDTTITGASKAAACVIDSTGHGKIDDDIVNIQDAGGMVEINDASYVITKINDNSFSIPVDSTGFTTYTTGGTASGNAIQYSSGKYLFTCSGAPDNTTSVYATYEESSGAPKSKAGLVRASSLYMWGDADNPSRLWYSSTNDEDAWNNSTSGGYIDIDPLDGNDLTGCLNYFQSLVLIKENSLHRLDNFPGDTVFRVEPLQTDLGCISYRTAMNDGTLITFLAPGGWIGMTSTDRYGDIMKATDIDEKFKSTTVRYANSSAYAEYNQLDKQLWLALYDGSDYLPDIYVINLKTGGQLSLYQFKFTHSSFKYSNGEMLIGGSDGNLYKLVDDESTFLDNGVSYANKTSFRSAFVDWKAPFNRKHNKKLECHAYGKGGITANLKLYKDQNYLAFDTATLPFTTTHGEAYINPDGVSLYIYDMDYYINSFGASTLVNKKFNYQNIMFEVTDIEGSSGAEFYGMDFVSALIGE